MPNNTAGLTDLQKDVVGCEVGDGRVTEEIDYRDASVSKRKKLARLMLNNGNLLIINSFPDGRGSGNQGRGCQRPRDGGGGGRKQ